MHPAIMAIAVSTQLLTPISDTIPKLNVEATCRGSVEADKAVGLDLPQSFDKCMSDENSAHAFALARPRAALAIPLA
jgi:hypothetical protein